MHGSKDNCFLQKSTIQVLGLDHVLQCVLEDKGLYSQRGCVHMPGTWYSYSGQLRQGDREFMTNLGRLARPGLKVRSQKGCGCGSRALQLPSMHRALVLRTYLVQQHSTLVLMGAEIYHFKARNN